MVNTEMADRRINWWPGHGDHVESFFIKANEGPHGRALWLRFTILESQSRRQAKAEVWAVAFPPEGHPIAIKRSLVPPPTLLPGSTNVDMGLARIIANSTEGDLSSGDHTIRWALQLDDPSPPLHPFPYPRMYHLPFPTFKVLSPKPQCRVTGFLEVDGKRWEVSSWTGMMGHNWGKAHSPRYVWAHCSAFDTPESVVFEGFSAKIALGPLMSPYLTMMVLRVNGTCFRAGLPWGWPSVRVEHHRWRFMAPGPQGLVIQGTASSRPELTAALRYENPQGPAGDCLNSKMADLELSLLHPKALPRLFRSHGQTALEVMVPPGENHAIPLLA